MDDERTTIDLGELDEANVPDGAQFTAEDAVELQRQKVLKKQAEVAIKELKAKAQRYLDATGMTNFSIGGRRFGLTTTTYYGVQEGLELEFKEWMERVAPSENIPPTTRIKRAVELAMDRGEAIPECIKENERQSLSDRQA